MQMFAIVLVRLSRAVTENYTIPMIVIRVLVLSSLFITKLAAYVDVFFAKELFEMRPLILGAAKYMEDLQGTKSECSEAETARQKCELY